MSTTAAARPLAVVTGASSGIGLELARLCAAGGHDLLLAADRPLDAAEKAVAAAGGRFAVVEADLATAEGVGRLVDAIAGRPVAVLCANAGQGVGDGFLDQEWEAIRHVVETNVTGTLQLIHRVGQSMRTAGQGRILVTGSIAGYVPGAYHAVYNGSKAFMNSFAAALREELKDTGVSVTLLMPGATETDFFERAGMQDTKVATQPKDDPADVARTGYEAMMRGDAEVVHGLGNRLLTAAADVLPASVLAHQHANQAAPGTGKKPA